MILSAHAGWNTEEAHDFLDINNDGDISVTEIKEVMAKYQIDQTLLSHLSTLITTMEKNEDMMISLSKFKEYVEPITSNSSSSLRPRCHRHAAYDQKPRVSDLSFE